MELSLDLVWKVIPEYLVEAAEQSEDGLAKLSRWGFLYTIAASVSLATAAGASIKFLGFPGDLPDVINCVHKLGYVPMRQTLPMVSQRKLRRVVDFIGQTILSYYRMYKCFRSRERTTFEFFSLLFEASLPSSFLSSGPQICCSLFSIAAGGSLGPEAPLVAVSASASGYLSMHYFKHDIVMVRKCTIIGMSAGLSAFFGVQLGGKSPVSGHHKLCLFAEAQRTAWQFYQTRPYFYLEVCEMCELLFC